MNERVMQQMDSPKTLSGGMGLTVDSLQLTFVPSSKSRDTKTMPNIKNPTRSNVDIVP